MKTKSNPIRSFLGVMFMAIVVVCIAKLWPSEPRSEKGPAQFSEMWQVYTFRPEVSATSYNSKSGNATIIWVSGIDVDPSPSVENSF